MASNKELLFYTTPEHSCSYLADQQAKSIFLDPEQELNTFIYSQLIDLGFRRSGKHVYRPNCNHCEACISVRIPVDYFIPKRQQRRILKKNADLGVKVITSIDTDEHYQLYEKYISLRHSDGDMYPPERDSYRDFLCQRSSMSYYLQYSLDDKIVGVAVSDALNQGLSAVYSFFDPDYEKRSLGGFMILNQVEQCKKLGLAYLYLGYWVKNSKKMAYKSDYRPLELYINQQWLRLS